MALRHSPPLQPSHYSLCNYQNYIGHVHTFLLFIFLSCKHYIHIIIISFQKFNIASQHFYISNSFRTFSTNTKDINSWEILLQKSFANGESSWHLMFYWAVKSVINLVSFTLSFSLQENSHNDQGAVEDNLIVGVNILKIERLCVTMLTGRCTDRAMPSSPPRTSTPTSALISSTLSVDSGRTTLSFLLMNTRI